MLGDRLGVEVEPALRVYPRGAAEPCAPPPVDLRLELAAGRTEPLKRGAPRAIVVRLILGGEPARAIVALTDACRRLSSLCLGRVCCIEPSEAILTGNLTAGNPSGCLLPVPTGSRCTGVGAVGGVSTANLPAKITCDPSMQQTQSENLLDSTKVVRSPAEPAPVARVPELDSSVERATPRHSRAISSCSSVLVDHESDRPRAATQRLVLDGRWRFAHGQV
jgi:hypothetical protein